MSKHVKQPCEFANKGEVNGVIQDGLLKEINQKINYEGKRYESVMDYCIEVAKNLTQRQAFYVLDLADVLWRIQMWKSKLPNVDIFYAVKANTDLVLLEMLVLLGLSFDCASQGEIEMVLSVGGQPNKIIFAHTIKTEEELKFASDAGVDLMTFDNEEELLKVHRIYPNARLVLRLAPTQVNCAFDLSDKFGCSEEEAIELLILAKQLHMNVVGISFHVGGLCDDSVPFTSTIRTCRKLFDKAHDLGFTFTILDLGGGFSGQPEKDDIFLKIADNIQHVVTEIFPPESGVKIIAEPGCYIVASPFQLVCTVLGKKTLKNTGDGQIKRHYFFNDGLYGSFFHDIELYGIKLKALLPEIELKRRPEFESRIFGQTCCSEDVICRKIIMPDMKVGERMLWKNMGAYCRGVSSTFCGVPLTEVRHMFVKNQKLNLDWIGNKKEDLKNFLKKRAIFIGCTEHDI